jgi:hypothetical protein
VNHSRRVDFDFPTKLVRAHHYHNLGVGANVVTTARKRIFEVCKVGETKEGPAITVMLKLTMNPRKRKKQQRAFPHRLRLPKTSNMQMAMDEDEDCDDPGEALKGNLHAMLRQERSGKYNCMDYLSMTVWEQSVYQVMQKPNIIESGPRPLQGRNTRIDEYCREQIAEWSFRVVDYFRIDREVVALSLSFLDRFLATCRCDRTSFKLAATTTLHLAVKLLYPCKLADLGILSDLSRGEFDMNDVSKMEASILTALTWDLHPPTSIAFASIFTDYFFASRVVSISSADLDDIYDVSSFFCELAVCDYFFVPMHESTVALAAVLNALEGMFGPENSLAAEISQAAVGLNFGLPQDLAAARNRLWEIYERSEECALHNDKGVEAEHLGSWSGAIFVKKSSSASSSPVSVSKPSCHSAIDFGYAHRKPSLRNGSW